MKKSKLTITLIVSAAIVATGGTVLAASSLKSTAQRAAEAAPPPPSEITASIEKRQLQDSVQLTCKPGFLSEAAVMGPATTPRVLTKAPLNEGDPIGDGTLIGEVNGSPVFAAIGSFPLYRELRLNDTGPDARLVNDALVRAGLLVQLDESTASTVTAHTVRAVAALYRGAGYAPPNSGDAVVARSAFEVLESPGTVAGAAHKTGDLGTDPILTAGLGHRGLLCSSASGSVPSEAKTGQKARVTSLGAELYPVVVEPGSRSGAKPAGSSQAGEGASSDQGGSGASQRDASQGDKGRIFIDIGKDMGGSPAVSADLILAESKPDSLVVPSSALWTRGSDTLVTVVEDDGCRDVAVTIDFTAAGESTVAAPAKESGLKVGDRVIVTGAAK
ncbi:hypothetical protein [Sinomonas terrae]|uniref:Peptidoglycan-binding protein n=1 Tax=Sinomonas terrae TaxID=2908838 RepID=A0ABS9U3Q0_9MICC|nr:hypothetical protein [Sinomonas terrae]MCH6471304.1 hypothetical protein [Sinomonas terrae]